MSGALPLPFRRRMQCPVSTLGGHPLLSGDSGFGRRYEFLRREASLCDQSVRWRAHGPVGPVYFHSVMFPDDAEFVIHELQRRQASKQEQSRCTKKAKTKWPELHRSEFPKAGLRWGEPEDMYPGSDVSGSPWYHVLPQREKEVLTYGLKVIGGDRTVDTSQSVTRLQFAKMRDGIDMLPTICPKMTLFVPFAKPRDDIMYPRPMLGRELMALQAYPLDEVFEEQVANFVARLAKDRRPAHDVEPVLADLAGNMFPGTVVQALLLSTFLAMPWAEAVGKPGRACKGGRGTDSDDESGSDEAFGMGNIMSILQRGKRNGGA